LRVDEQLQVKVKEPCERCEALGRIARYEGFTGGYEIGENAGTQSCPDCEGSGCRESDWMAVPEFRRRYLDAA